MRSGRLAAMRFSPVSSLVTVRLRTHDAAPFQAVRQPHRTDRLFNTRHCVKVNPPLASVQERDVSLALIVMGDRTTHGGTVITADMTFYIHGKCAARVGDFTVCPKCKGVFPIKTGAADLVDGEGRGYARHMDETACGARLISSQITTTWNNHSSTGPEAESEASTAHIAAPADSGICLECLVTASLAGSATIIRQL
jgi:uncharacterized Zn-binding protein involved in type VI secretion